MAWGIRGWWCSAGGLTVVTALGGVGCSHPSSQWMAWVRDMLLCWRCTLHVPHLETLLSVAKPTMIHQKPFQPPSPRIGIFAVGRPGFTAVSCHRQTQPNLSGAWAIGVHGTHELAAPKQLPWANETVLIGKENRQSPFHQMALEILASYTTEIESAIQRFDLIYVVARLGFAVDTKLAQLVSEIARSAGIFNVCVVSTPIDFEGETLTKTALHGLSEIRKHSNALFEINMNLIFEREAENISTEEFFEMINQLFMSLYHPIKAMAIGGGLTDIDISGVQRTLARPGDTAIGSGTATGENCLAQATLQAIEHPLLGCDVLARAQGVLVSIRRQAGHLTKKDSGKVLKIVKEFASKDAEIACVLHCDDLLKDTVEVGIFATGIQPQTV